MHYCLPREGNTAHQLFEYFSTSEDKHKLIIIILNNYIISVLELTLGYTVKSSPLPLGVPLGFAIANSLRQWVIFDRVSLDSTWDRRSNIAFCLWIFSLALPLGIYVLCLVHVGHSCTIQGSCIVGHSCMYDTGQMYSTEIEEY